MPNLVGIGNSQVPTNAMLGGLAYQDSVGEINIDKIKARTSDTATDIFVYDTRKDSDGGAWRHRTQNTSWYNESVSQARGARKEFPAVAVLVAYNNGLVIYDGDDPNLPMWMEAWQYQNNSSGNTNWWGGSGTGTSVAAMNGMVVLTTTTGVKNLHFINDRMSVFYTPASGNYSQPGGISNRNVPYVAWYLSDEYYSQILNSNVKDVAMTVLPDAPIDINTGLPFPTIAVATSAGVTVVKDRRDAVPNFSTLTPGGGVEMNSVSFDDNNNLVIGRNNFILYRSDHPHYLSNQVDNGYTVTNRKITAPSVGEDSSGSTSFTDVVGISDSSIAFDTETLGLGLYDVNAQNNSNSMVAYIRATHNTGWMHGNCKGAFLSDTDDTNVTGETIDLTNGSSVAGNWSSISANSIVAGTTGVLGRYDTGTDGSVLVAGKQYFATLTISNYNGSGDLGVASGQGFDANFRYSANGTYHTYITYTSGEVQLFYRNTNTATIGFSLKEVDLDRSVNGKGLEIYGTITKTPVTTGAELVSYSGVSATNYLQQPYNSDLNFGTGDFSIFVWAKKNTFSTNHYIIDRARTTPSWATGNRSYFIINSNGYHRFKLAGGSQQDGDQSIMPAGVFTQIGFVRRSGIMELYFNGQLVQTIGGSNASASFDNGGTDMSTTVNRYGDGFAADYTFDGMALLRISASAPSADQVKKMYNDEKCLFHKNAKCTLYGTSDDVKALAFDDTNDVLHVGTSGGRSEFQGLNRINNTTTAVTTAISASNELVAEQ